MGAAGPSPDGGDSGGQPAGSPPRSAGGLWPSGAARGGQAGSRCPYLGPLVHLPSGRRRCRAPRGWTAPAATCSAPSRSGTSSTPSTSTPRRQSPRAAASPLPRPACTPPTSRSPTAASELEASRGHRGSADVRKEALHTLRILISKVLLRLQALQLSCQEDREQQ